MSLPSATFNADRRRANARRTAWIVAVVAFAIFLLSIVNAYWH